MKVLKPMRIHTQYDKHLHKKSKKKYYLETNLFYNQGHKMILKVPLIKLPFVWNQTINQIEFKKIQMHPIFFKNFWVFSEFSLNLTLSDVILVLIWLSYRGFSKLWLWLFYYDYYIYIYIKLHVYIFFIWFVKILGVFLVCWSN